MTATTHTYSAVVKRPSGHDAVLSLKAGVVTLDATRSPHVQATLDVAVPAGWAPLEPTQGGHWEPTGAPQLPFIPESAAPPFYTSEPPLRWVPDDPKWTTDPVDDEDPVELPDPVQLPFIPEGGAPPFYISDTKVIVIPPPRPAELRDLDPRLAPRIVLTASRVDAFGSTQTREFNLTLRERGIEQADGTIRLRLTSDESLVEDYAPLVDDFTPLLGTATLESVVRYVLETVVGDIDFEYPTSTPLVAAWSAQNMFPNPSFRNNVDGWVAGAGAAAPTWSGGIGATGEVGYLQITHSAPVGHVATDRADPWTVGATPGRRYGFRVSLRSPHTMNIRVGAQFRNDAGAILGSSKPTTFMPAITSWNQHVFVTDAAPTGTTQITPFVEWSGSASGRVLHVDCAILDEGEFVPPYFDGSSVDTATYAYEWADEAHTSPSRRTLLVDATGPEALVWRAGVGGMNFLAPLVQSFGLRLINFEHGKWHLRAADWQATGSLSIAYAVNMIGGDDVISREEDWYSAAVVRYRWMASGIQHERIDSFALPSAHPVVRTLDIDAPYPGTGFAEYTVRRAQGRGREVTATAVADWNARADMPATVVLNGALPQVGLAHAISFDLTRDEMTITTRTVDEGTPE